MRADELLYQRQETLAKSREAEVLAPAALACSAESAAGVAIAEKENDPIGQIVRSPEIDIVTGLAVEVDLRGRVVNARDHRDAMAHGLDVHETKTFAAARHRQDGRPTPHRGYLFFGDK